VTRDLVADGAGALDEGALDSAGALRMDEDAFRVFYDRTARAVWAYLAHVTGDPHAADDLLQETFYRFLRARRDWQSDAHRRNYLFRIATNLLHDRWRRGGGREMSPLDDEVAARAGHGADEAVAADLRADLHRALARLPARDRQALWLAYAEGSSHEDIAEALGLRAKGIRVLLFRARKKLAALLRGGGSCGN
jgi:RNA polymerase sigma-70 factor, ECF subfamily